MLTRSLIITGLLLSGCGDPGPTEAEIAAKELDRACGRLYSSLTKVYRDELYKGGVADVEFAKKGEFVAQCAEAGLSDEQRRCMDPNVGGGEECEKALEPVKEKVKALGETLLAPMKADDKKEEKAEGEAEAEEKPAEE